ncbi:MAG TPA: substrate-binding domain-containing protein [Gemmataceae bacterium]|nr:substrate-binding domain-containing protein [Gemmataceae bacterium]
MMRASGHCLAITICIAICGCGSSTKQASKYKIAVIPKGLTHEFWQSVHRGAEQAAKDLTVKGISTQVIWDGPRKEDDAKEQIDIIKLNLSNKVNGLVLAPQHSETMIASVEDAQQQGVPVVIIDSGLNNPDAYIKYVATNNYHGGELAADHLLKVLRDDGNLAPKLVLLRYQTGSESTDQREQGFIDFVEKAKQKDQPGITWLSKDGFYAGATKDSAMKTAGTLLDSLRDKGIDGIFAPNESSASGLLQVIRSQKEKLPKKMRFMGFDSSDPLLEALEDGEIDGLVVQDPYRMGYLGVWTAVQYLEGFDVAPDGKKIQSTGEHLITKANLKDKDTEQLFKEDLQLQRKIELPDYSKKR